MLEYIQLDTESDYNSFFWKNVIGYRIFALVPEVVSISLISNNKK